MNDGDTKRETPTPASDASDGGMVWEDFHALTDEDVERAVAEDPDTFLPTENELRAARRVSSPGRLSVESAGEDIRRAALLLAEVQRAGDLDERAAALAQRLGEMVRLSTVCLALLAPDRAADAEPERRS